MSHEWSHFRQSRFKKLPLIFFNFWHYYINHKTFRQQNIVMSNVLDKQTAIVELFKAGNTRQDICQSLKVNRMLVWRSLKRYEETRDIQNRPGQGRSRTARTRKLVTFTRKIIRRNRKRSFQNLAKESNMSYGTISTVLRKNQQMFSFKHVKKHQFLFKLLTSNSKDARFFYPAFKMVRCQTSFSVMRWNLMLNTTLTPKMIKLSQGMEMKDPVWWLGSYARSQWWDGQP